MSMTLIDIPDDLMAELKAELGTASKRETVIRSMREVLAARARQRLIEQLRAMDGLDLDDPDVMAQAWE